MKKKILFVTHDMECGGVQKALISLLNEINFSNSEIDLLLIEKKGVLLKEVPSNINIIELDKDKIDYFLLKQGFINSIKKNIVKMKVKKLAILIYYFIYGIVVGNMGISRQKMWDKICKYKVKIVNDYDVAIAYNTGGLSWEIVGDSVSSKKKIAWIHSDYSVYKRDKNLDKKTLSKFDNIIAVSETCKEVFIKNFSHYKAKTKVLYNITSEKYVNEKSKEKIDFSADNFNIVSVSRLDENKGFDLAIESAIILSNKNINFKWYIIGDGPEYKNLLNKVRENRLEDKIIFKGFLLNPYPYIKNCDLFVHPSKFEGKSIAVDEAKLLCKMIILTDYPTAKDQITNEVNGLIVKQNPFNLAEGIEKIFEIYKLKRDNGFKKQLENEKNKQTSILCEYNLLFREGVK